MPLSAITILLLSCSGAVAQDPLFVVQGTRDHEALGTALAWVGDIDGDGINDFAAGAYNVAAKALNVIPIVPAEKKPPLLRGSVLFLSGKDGHALGRVEELGTDFGFGTELASPGDLDGDGCEDVVVGAPHIPSWSLLRMLLKLGLRSREGVMFAYSAKTRKLLWKVEAPYDGMTMAPCGDIDRDGRPDVAVCSESVDEEISAQVLVISGKGGKSIWKRKVARPGKLVGAGDQNEDGVPDLFFGQTFLKNAETRPGQVSLLSGRDGAVLWRASSPRQSEYFGESLCRLGDLDRDGHPDLAVADASWGKEESACICLYSGRNGSLLREIVVGKDMARPRSLAAVGDVDRDETPDLAVSASRRVRVLSGRDGAVLCMFEGHEVCGAVDVDPDGRLDLLVGDPGYPGFENMRGIVRVVSCRAGERK